MRLPLVLTALLAGSSAAALAQSAPRVRPVWWQSPAQPVQLHVEDGAGKPRPIRILPMCPLESFKADPTKGAVLLRREEPDPSDPAAKPRWTPYASAPVPSGTREVLMIVQPGGDPKSGQAMVVPMDADALPWGGTRLVNLTPGRLLGMVDGKRFAVEPGDSAVLPFVASKRAVVDVLIGAERQGKQELVFSSKGIFTPAKRTVLFVLRTPAGAHETRAIEEPNPEPTSEDGAPSAPAPGPAKPAGARAPAPAAR